MANIRQNAERLLASHINIIPLTKKNDGKGCLIQNWQEIVFNVSDFTEENNIGINLRQSNLIDVDLDSLNAEIFGRKFLNNNTAIFGVKSPKGCLLQTHYLFSNLSNLSFLKRSYPDKSTIAELRVEGNTVCPPSTAQSKLFNNQWCERVWIKSGVSIANDNDLLKSFNKLCVASVLKDILAKRNSNNLPFVKLGSCLLKYTDWDLNERWSFIESIVSTLKFDWKDIQYKLKTIEKNFDQEDKKISGYKAFADEVGLDVSYTKEIFSWIGKVQEEKTSKKIIDFFSNRMTDVEFSQEVKQEFLVSPIIPREGLGILAGRPKSMKSFLTLDLAYKIQNGTNERNRFLGQGQEKKGDVLLLALEDSKDSMAGRIQSMKSTNLKHPTTFIGYNCPQLDKGFEESLSLWCETVSDPRLVIIDTFQKIKPLSAQGQGKANAYEIDYYYLGKLKDLAHKHKVFILYVHHLSQASRDYSWDRIMGSTGHQGVPDAMYMLDREEVGNKASLKGRGRNIPDFSYDLEWNTKQDLRYEFSGDSFVRKTEKHKREIYLAMKTLTEEGKVSVKPKDIYGVLNIVTNQDKNNINKNMQRMREKSELLQGDRHGEYKLACRKEDIDAAGNLVQHTHDHF